jgi:protein tyrosine/serine phosphatase
MKENLKRSIIHVPDEEKQKFMEIKSGNISPGILYRSSSPIKGGDEAKKIKSDLAVKADIKCVINLDDDSSAIQYFSKDVPWYHKLVEEENVICLPMTFTIPGSSYNESKLKTALQFIIDHEGPYLIHCFAGIDRAGFVSALLEAFMWSSLKTICKNYLSAFLVDNSASSRMWR